LKTRQHLRGRLGSIPLNRRLFLKAAGYSLLAYPLLSLWPRARALASSQTQAPLRIGLLLPAQTLYPRLGESLRAGLELGLGQAGQPAELVAATFGAGQGGVWDNASRLLDQSPVDVLVGLLNGQTAERLQPLLAGKQKTLVACDVGANAISQARPDPNLYFSTLSYWQASYALGAWAAANLGKRAIIASSLYDAGYDTLFAFQLGLESAGGQVLSTAITHRPGDGDNAGVFADVARLKPNFIYGAYCGPAAIEFVRTYRDSGLAAHYPLIGSAFMTAEDLLPKLGRAAAGVRSALGWAGNVGSADYASFATAYQKAAGRPADPFALLGYDTAQLLLAVRAAGASSRQGSLAVASPRGALQVDGQNQLVGGPVYLREVRQVSGEWQNVAIAELPVPADLEARLQAARSGPRTGWLNAYLA
jgi:branched-chain amino acid transport system substrate-binding protein